MASKADGVAILRSLGTAGGHGVVHVEHLLDSPIDNVWDAVTDPARLEKWLGQVSGDLRQGGEFRACFRDGWEGTGRIEQCRPPQCLKVSTRDAESNEAGEIELRLKTQGEQTLLVWEERGMPIEHLAAYGPGVQIHVEHLTAHLSGDDLVDMGARWKELGPGYDELAAKVVAN